MLNRLKKEGNPLIDGEQATFVWVGENPPLLFGDFNDWRIETAVSLQPTAGNLYTHTITLPRNAYIEYAFVVDTNDPDADNGRILDPHNANTKSNGVGATNNYFYMPEYVVTPLISRQENSSHGTLTEHTFDFYEDEERSLWLYQPPVDHPVPLLIVLDGRDYLEQGHLDNIVDNLIAAKKVAPFAMLLVDNGADKRYLEYGCSDVIVQYLVEFLLPLAQKHLNLIDIDANPGAFGIMGASMGGLMSLFAGLRCPHVLGKILSQSGAFTVFGWEFVVWDLVRRGEIRPLTIWMNVGQYEFLLDANRKMHQLLQKQGYDVTYQEYPAGHNYPAWVNEVANGLMHLFPPHTNE